MKKTPEMKKKRDANVGDGINKSIIDKGRAINKKRKQERKQDYRKLMDRKI